MATAMRQARRGQVRRLTALGLVLGGALMVTPSCGKTTGSGTDSHTHWLKRCSDKGDCGDLECLCGVCTKSCESGSQCGGLGSPAVCGPVSSCDDGAETASVCTAACSEDGDCASIGAHLTCADGHCQSAPSTDAGQAGSAGLEDASTSGGRSSGGAGHDETAGAGESSSTNTGGSGGRSSGSGGDVGSDGGAGGAAISGDRLVLDPSSLVFFGLPTSSIRYGVTGYDPAQRTCATLVWEETTTTNPGALCNVFTTQGENYHVPYVVLKTDTEGPCTESDWDYQGNVETTSSTGCVDFSAVGATSVDMVDVEVGVEGDLFTGTIVANNRPEGMVTFGFEYVTDVPEDVYVQIGGDLGLPTWLQVTKAGQSVGLFERCDIPNCGTSDGVCGIAFSRAANITGSTSRGSIYLTWDGQVWSEDPVNQCLKSEPATPGTYQVEVCYGWSTTDSGAGLVVTSPVCETQEFTYPTDESFITVDNGG